MEVKLGSLCNAPFMTIVNGRDIAARSDPPRYEMTLRHQLHGHQHRIVAAQQAFGNVAGVGLRNQLAASPLAPGARMPDVTVSSVAKGATLRPSTKRAPMVEPTPP